MKAISTHSSEDQAPRSAGQLVLGDLDENRYWIGHRGSHRVNIVHRSRRGIFIIRGRVGI